MKWLRELMAALISIAIVGVAAFMLVATHLSVTPPTSIDKDYSDESKPAYDAKAAIDKEGFTRQKDVLQLTLGLLGTVLGFYLGRNPAENRADQAEKHANTAEGRATNAEQKKEQAQSEAGNARQGKQEIESKINAVQGPLAELKLELASAQTSVPKTLAAGGSPDVHFERINSLIATIEAGLK